LRDFYCLWERVKNIGLSFICPLLIQNSYILATHKHYIAEDEKKSGTEITVPDFFGSIINVVVRILLKR
jgi:hypothetical protein